MYAYKNIEAVGNTFITGTKPNENLSSSKTLRCRYGDLPAHSLFAFKLPEELPEHKKVFFTASDIDGGGYTEPATLSLYETESWDVKSVTFNNFSGLGKKITDFAGNASICICDMTEYLEKSFAEGKREYYFAVVNNTDSHDVGFTTTANDNPILRPSLSFMSDGETYHTDLNVTPDYGNMEDPFEWAEQLYADYISRYDEVFGKNNENPHFIKDRESEYSTPVKRCKSVNDPEDTYTVMSRSFETLEGFVPKETEFDEYGGDLSRTYEATGFFRTEKIDGRWYLITPLGHPYFNIGVCTVQPTHTEIPIKAMEERFGGDENNWAKATAKLFKDNYIFSLGGACPSKYFDVFGNELNLMTSFGTATRYGASHNLCVPAPGCWNFKDNNTLPVFDPAFDTYTEKFLAEELKPYKDNPRYIGYMTDNEIAVNIMLLPRYLTVDYTKPQNAYSYAAAWVWLKHETGKENPTFCDLTIDLCEKFRGFVYDRYFKVVATNAKKADKNHLFMGCRFKKPAYFSEAIMHAEGYWSDIGTHNYYFVWTPDSETLSNWDKWCDKPFIVSEFYAKGMDSGFPNRYGAGIPVPTQSDRAAFLENYALKLIEAKNCVGFHWFRYQDCDPAAKGVNVSETEGNKGIVKCDYEPYPELFEAFTHLGKNVYTLQEFFDKRSG